MRILILGGSRFVGPLIVEGLLAQHVDVTVFNRGTIQTEYPNGVTFIQGDRSRDLGKIKDHFDSVIDTNASDAAQMQQTISSLDFDFFLQFSTIAVYKNTDKMPLSEDSAIGEYKMFSNNKRKVEIEDVLKKSGIKYASIRPVFILGPKNYVNRESFIYSSIREGKTLVIPGGGNARLQFVFSKDVANSIVLLATKQLEGVFNCATMPTISLNELVEQMGKIAGKNPVIGHNMKTDGEKWDGSEFPFPNIDLFCGNKKLEELGIKFTPLLKGLDEDYKSYYSKVISE